MAHLTPNPLYHGLMFSPDLSTLRALPLHERPRERLLACGAHALTTTELLALIIGTGTRSESSLDVAKLLLDEASDLATFARADPMVLSRRRGLGLAKASRIIAALELGRRAAMTPMNKRLIIPDVSAAAQLLVPRLKDRRSEHLVALLLDGKRGLIRVVELYQGTVDGLEVSASEIFRPVVEAGANALVLAHNHPSGDPTPSDADRVTTRVLVQAGRVLGIDLIDHLVVADTAWFAIRAGYGGNHGAPVRRLQSRSP